jgi:acetolactate synthase-1/2/3 large subunit
MADGYARASGKLGVCACQAIGAANLAAGMLDAYMAHSPILALSGGGGPGTRERNTYQEVDQRPIWAGLTKMSARVETAARLPDLLGLAMRAATTGAPGPAHLELNLFTGGVLDEPLADEAPLPDPRFARCPALRQAAPAEDVAAAAKALAEAERPIVVAGSGIRASGAQAALTAFVRRLNLPLATSLDAKAVLPESEPLSVGVVGNYSRETANMAVSEADLVIFVGTTTGNMVTAQWAAPKPGVKAIQIDVEPRELGRNYPLLAGLAGDPATVLDQLGQAAGTQPDRRAWRERIAALRREWLDAWRPVEQSDNLPIRPERLARSLSEALPDGALVVVDTGHTAIWAARHLYLDRPGHGLLRCAGSLGWAYPAALGAKCAQPDRPVVCLTGDGGFLYHLAEMETAVRYGIATVTVVNNNNGFSQERHIWDEDSAWDHNWRFAPVSYAKLAEGFGCKAYVVEKPGYIGPAIQDAISSGRPAIVEVIGDPQIGAPPPWRPGEPVIRPRDSY